MPIKRTLLSVKKADTAHPRSRKATQLNRALVRDSHLSARLQKAASSKQHPLVDRLTWFQLQLEKDFYTPIEVDIFVSQYIDRFNQEMQEIEASLRPGRPVPTRLAMLKHVQKHEREIHENGSFEMVDLLSPQSVAAFKAWSGDYNSISLLKIVRYKKK
jgi:translation machinery-associated protein 16